MKETQVQFMIDPFLILTVFSIWRTFRVKTWYLIFWLIIVCFCYCLREHAVSIFDCLLFTFVAWHLTSICLFLSDWYEVLYILGANFLYIISFSFIPLYLFSKCGIFFIHLNIISFGFVSFSQIPAYPIEGKFYWIFSLWLF